MSFGHNSQYQANALVVLHPIYGISAETLLLKEHPKNQEYVKKNKSNTYGNMIIF